MISDVCIPCLSDVDDLEIVDDAVVSVRISHFAQVFCRVKISPEFIQHAIIPVRKHFLSIILRIVSLRRGSFNAQNEQLKVYIPPSVITG